MRPVKKKRLYEDIVGQIKNLIKKGKLKSGDRLPPERELAEIFQVSRNSVREAIRALEEKQLIRSMPGDGTYVIIEEDMIVETLARAIKHEKDKLYEIFQFRKLIEPEIVFLAAKNASLQDIKKLESMVDKQKRMINDGKKSIKLDEDFHLFLSHMSKNTIFLRITQTLNDILGETRAEVFQKESRKFLSLEGHQKVLKAVKQRNPNLARKTMKEHLRSIGEIVLVKESEEDLEKF
jgi:GntR family transcriptional repressor for pyruvate dehydrogenase complex